ncbi:hypothetical protein [Roseibium sp.]|uniref:hypothetical protein n=1 Tax=Roseibium sp. TaxID=1936156 RepID=UPI003BAF2202
MRTTKKIITTLLAAGVVSTAAIGSAFADFPRQSYGDLSGNEPVSIEQMRIANQKALNSAGGSSVRVNNASASADFPRQAYGDLNGNNRIPVREISKTKNNSNVLILPFLGDWNGTSKAGFPHQ